ncbi:carbohydrate ABC transporter permease [Paenibacillus radicis (ex Gao et al. 2016)]|uniref:ABC transporter permease n=1 Tax=Paenibacillus radicis (ex Gao et al. 2016) TaxID=1737354 RepID=A0A917GXG7_9BACL|nr:sugar ABC transporter permease [Paenibacillus radicis (ex Gao et al. 2016)]GGG60202.1 ABC transporter permease [Paenibacillus radicis (ex Gao et al. 2016)]
MSGSGTLRRFLPYLMVAPAVLILVTFYVYPIGYNVYLSFFSWNMRGPMKFIGLKNYTELFTSHDFTQTLMNTIWYTVMEVTLVIVLALLLALFLQKNTLVNRFIQTISFTPNIISLVSVSLIWMWLMNTDKGLFNYILSLFGGDAVGWLTDKRIALFSIVLVSVWKSVGFNVLIILSALGSIPPYLYEAAALDRASKRSVFFQITLKMISPTLFFLTLMNIISSFQAFETISVMTNGGPSNATNTLIFSIYKQSSEYYRVGYASAIAVVLMAIVGLITLVYFRVLNKRVHYR